MKTTITTVLFLFLGFVGKAQSYKFSLGIEYAPAFTNVTQQYWNPYETGLWPVHNYFVRAGYRLSSKFYLTSGLGLLTARLFQYEDLGQPYVESIKAHRFHNYLVVPLGFKYQFGQFFVNPDIGVGLNVSNKVKSEIVFADGSISTGKGEDKSTDINNITVPLSLGFGNEVKLKSCTVSIGVRGYYGLNTVSPISWYGGHYYGFGIFGGVSF